ncbi:HNH endonuclease [Candidatus Micrarchaeota archaeon]|nr:HNH endonuclease [Candidatus Micrarchaeota archaeon]MBU1681309.1 HNH endonuclease [Candidatus Micrarchaeota archaeon]
MKKFCPTFNDAKNWKGKIEREYRLSHIEIQKLQTEILERDKGICQYCSFEGKKYQTINHIDGDTQNNSKSNLATVCPMCKLILNTDYGCNIEGIVWLYTTSNISQKKIIQMTRQMRIEGKTDDQIIRTLGLRNKVPYKRDRAYLERLFGFVSSWRGSLGHAEEALEYGYEA